MESLIRESKKEKLLPSSFISQPLHLSLPLPILTTTMGKLKLKLTTHLILTLTLLFTSPLPTKGAFVSNQSLLPANTVEYRPIDRAVAMDGDGNRRELAPFQLCLECRCCAATDPNNCSSMACCFGIDCNLPEKPFGVCAFVPKTCNCTSCS